MISRASGVSISRWISALERARAVDRVVADLGEVSGRPSVSSSVMCRSASRLPQPLELDLDDLLQLLASVSAWNTTISSTRFRNSGRKCCRSASSTSRFMCS